MRARKRAVLGPGDAGLPRGSPDRSPMVSAMLPKREYQVLRASCGRGHRTGATAGGELVACRQGHGVGQARWHSLQETSVARCRISTYMGWVLDRSLHMHILL